MHFLLNDVVFDLNDLRLGPRQASQGFQALDINDVTRMGKELYAKHPLLHASHRARALRLVSLISAKTPTINAALFVAPDFDCAVEDVVVRYMTLGPHIMQQLSARQSAGELDVRSADRQVWRRLAA
jgi:hypothetical protein